MSGWEMWSITLPIVAGVRLLPFTKVLILATGCLNSRSSTCCAEVAKRQHGVAVYAVRKAGYVLPGEASFHCCFGKLRMHAILSCRWHRHDKPIYLKNGQKYTRPDDMYKKSCFLYMSLACIGVLGRRPQQLSFYFASVFSA